MKCVHLEHAPYLLYSHNHNFLFRLLRSGGIICYPKSAWCHENLLEFTKSLSNKWPRPLPIKKKNLAWEWRNGAGHLCWCKGVLFVIRGSLLKKPSLRWSKGTFLHHQERLFVTHNYTSLCNSFTNPCGKPRLKCDELVATNNYKYEQLHYIQEKGNRMCCICTVLKLSLNSQPFWFSVRHRAHVRISI